MECSFRFIVDSLQNSSPDNLIWGHNLSNIFSLFYISKGMEQKQRANVVTLLPQVILINLLPLYQL